MLIQVSLTSITIDAGDGFMLSAENRREVVEFVQQLHCIFAGCPAADDSFIAEEAPDRTPTHRFIDGPVNDDTEWFQAAKGRSVVLLSLGDKFCSGYLTDDFNPFADVAVERFEPLTR